MDHLEHQVNDLRYLTQTAITPLADSQGFTPHSLSSPVGSAVGNNSAHLSHQKTGELGATTSATKRKSPDDASQTKQQRSKRNRYISIACNECKRRKIKCNGETPCQRCGNLNLQCLYAPNCCSNSLKDSEEFKEMSKTVSRLQEQVETLFNNLNALRSETLRLAPIQDRSVPLPSAAGTPSSSTPVPTVQRPDFSQLRQSNYRGPTSHHYTLDVAKNTLQNMGYGSLGEDNEEHLGPKQTPTTSPISVHHTTEIKARSPPDPLWEFSKDELIRLCRLYEEEVGIMYPVVRIETVINHAATLTSWMTAAKKHGLVPPFGQDGGLTDRSTLELKLIVCSALIVERNGDSDQAARLFESVRPTTDKMLMSDPGDVLNVPILALVAAYWFLSNNEILAWRVMGQAARHCIELGLHRRSTIDGIADGEARRNALLTFWTAYILDRRWSFGAGLPFAILDEEIDPQLPYPEHLPYMVAMISFSQISARVWHLVRHFEANISMDLQPGQIDDLDRQIKQWYTSVPTEVRLELPDWDSMPRYLNPPEESQHEYDTQRLQIWTYLRLNQIRIWLHTPILHTHSSIMEKMHYAERAVKLAKNTIEYLSHINSTTNLYRKMQVFYHQFLTSAIAVLFLASCHAPVNFSASCREEFYLALDLIKDLSSKSYVSKRLWRTVRNLKNFAPRLGLAEEDPHSSAALTMAGLATGQMGTGPTPPPGSTQTSFSGALPGSAGGVDAAQDGQQISSEMSRIFEGYAGMNGFTHGLSAAEVPGLQSVDEPSAASTPGPFGARSATGEPGSVYQHFRDMF